MLLALVAFAAFLVLVGLIFVFALSYGLCENEPCPSLAGTHRNMAIVVCLLPLPLWMLFWALVRLIFRRPPSWRLCFGAALLQTGYLVGTTLAIDAVENFLGFEAYNALLITWLASCLAVAAGLTWAANRLNSP